ncbi:MAG: hypothetical protein WAN43_04335 [Rhodomicrobium sp.]|jgi:hypothetical protein
MQVFKTISVEIIGLAVLILSTAATLTVPDVGEFWLALATAITLFLLMYIRLHYESPAPKREEASR